MEKPVWENMGWYMEHSPLHYVQHMKTPVLFLQAETDWRCPIGRGEQLYTALRARGVPAWEAVVESAVRRLRPIVLTAAAAVLAMIPLSRSVFWGPMAVAIMGGLIVATALTLLALPAMYAAWFRVIPPQHVAVPFGD